MLGKLSEGDYQKGLWSCDAGLASVTKYSTYY